MSSAPNWRAIFSVRHDLEPPGYDEIFLDCIENPYVAQKNKKQDDKKKSPSKPRSRRTA